jgi:purine nucleosidase
MNKKILIDTDPGVDDALALILALRSDLDIRAISTVAGNVELDQAQTNANYLISKLNSNLKAIPGSDKPLKKDLVTTLVHGATGLGEIDIEPEENIRSEIGKIVEIITQEKINTIITLGPLTNIAKILQDSPELEEQINQIIIMGGAVNSPGNITPRAEFNIYVDPEAAEIVFKSKIKKVLVTLKVCQQVILEEKFFDRIEKPEIKDIILKIIRQYIKNNQEMNIDGAPMYDPLTVYYAISKKAYKTKKYNLDVIIDGRHSCKT